MPLRALVDGTDVLSPLMGDPEWDALRRDARAGRRVPVLPCCGSRAYQRESPRGFKHFYHPPRVECEHRGETEAHLLAKYTILQACERSGYTARTEWAEADWRADVLATQGDTRIAFEVELGATPLHQLIERQRRYTRSGVRGCWFCLKPPAAIQLPGMGPGLRARRDLPVFELARNHAADFQVCLYGRTRPLQDFVQALLSGAVSYRDTATVERQSLVAVGFFRTHCWNCAAKVDVYRVGGDDRSARAACGVPLRLESSSCEEMGIAIKPEFRPEIREAVEGYLQSHEGRDLRGAIIRRRQGHVPGFRSWLCFGCPTCYAPFVYTKLSSRPDRVVTLSVEILSTIELAWPHWCYPIDAERTSFRPDHLQVATGY